MFGPKKQKVSKSDIKKSIAKANDRLREANARMEDDIGAGNANLKSLEDKCKQATKDLEDIKDLQVYAKNELEAIQSELNAAELGVQKALSSLEELSGENAILVENNNKLKEKEVILSKSVALLESKKAESKEINSELKAMKREQADGQETLSLLGSELSSLEAEVEAYASRKSAAKSEFVTFQGEIDRSKMIAEGELNELEDFNNKMNLANGQEMARLDHAIADRLSELKDMDEMKFHKEYELSSIKSKISSVENRVKDAEQRIEYSVKKEQERVNKIKGDFKSWKVDALDELARMKIRGKMENIETAGLKEVLDG